jgi:hypothetical protein
MTSNLSTPRRRGRPAKYRENTERRAADALRKRRKRAVARRKRERTEKRAHQRDITQLQKARGGMIGRHIYPDGFISIFPEPTPAEKKLTNKILAEAGQGMRRGLYVTDAPQGAGLLIYSNQELRFKDTVELPDGRRAPLHCGHKVVPEGVGSHTYENEAGTVRSQFAKPLKAEVIEVDENIRRDRNSLECHVDGCNRYVRGVRTVRGREAYCCDLHAPIEAA